MGSREEYRESGFGDSRLRQMEDQLRQEGKSSATVCKYVRDAGKYLSYVRRVSGDLGKCFDQDMITGYRKYLAGLYSRNSINSMLAGVNYFLSMCGHRELRMQGYRIQRAAFRNADKELTKEEYFRLLRAAERRGNERLAMIIRTLGTTGIRIGELPFITAESLEARHALVSLKGKTRVVLLPDTLCKRLTVYASKRGIVSGSIFVTRNGNAVDRSNVLHEMKSLCKMADVDPKKAHPHNLRHLFAVTYYESYKDLCHLADILGHSNINTTRIYTAAGQAEMVQSIEMLGLL